MAKQYDAFDKANKVAHDSLSFYRQAVKHSDAVDRARDTETTNKSHGQSGASGAPKKVAASKG